MELLIEVQGPKANRNAPQTAFAHFASTFEANVVDAIALQCMLWAGSSSCHSCSKFADQISSCLVVFCPARACGRVLLNAVCGSGKLQWPAEPYSVLFGHCAKTRVTANPGAGHVLQRHNARQGFERDREQSSESLMIRGQPATHHARGAGAAAAAVTAAGQVLRPPAALLLLLPLLSRCRHPSAQAL
jgi:hypothetical protein